MDGIMQALGSLLSVLISVVTLLLNFLAGMLSIQGILGLLIGALVFWLAWRETKNVVGAVILLGITTLVVYIFAAYVLWPFLFQGSHASAASCYQQAGNDQKALALCATTGQGFIPGSSTNNNSSGSSPVIVIPQAQPTQAPAQVVRQWAKDGLTRLSASWNLFPGNWPSGLAGQLVGPPNLPQGVKASFLCTNCQLLTGKGDERWSVTLTDTTGQMSPVTVMVNGYFARESKGFNASPSGSESVGTGKWEDLCPSCYQDVVVATAVPAVPPTPIPAAGWWNNSGLAFPFHFKATTVDLGGGNKQDVCGWSSTNALILCDERDQPSGQSVSVSPQNFPNLPHP